jgi:hypothetical protein
MRNLFAIVGLLTLCGPALAENGTITITPFTAYYGEGQIEIRGAKMQQPIPVPNHLGDSSTDIAPGVQKICGAGVKAYYNSIRQTGGGGHGYNVIAGVCVKENE